MSSEVQSGSPARRRWRRVGLAFAVLVGLVASGLLVATTVLSRLDTPWVKARIQAAARGAGIELDYLEAGLTLGSGMRLKGFTIATPASLRGYASELVRIGSIDVTWGLSRLVARTPH